MPRGAGELLLVNAEEETDTGRQCLLCSRSSGNSACLSVVLSQPGGGEGEGPQLVGIDQHCSLLIH